MSLKFALPLAAAAVCLSLTGTARAVTYTETGDAGDSLATAQTVFGTAGTALTAISGALTLTNGISDSDIFKIFISSPSAFSASTTGFVAGRNNFDTQLALFTATGIGVVANDDTANGEQSSIPANSFTLPAGTYYLLISGSGRYATSGGGLIFPNFTDGTTDATGVYGPTGPGGASALSGYTGNSNDGGSYQIALTGAQFFAVPEPASFVYILAGAAGLIFVTRRARGVGAR